MENLEIREANEADLRQLLELYTHLHDNEMPETSASLLELWQKILADENHHILLGMADGKLTSSCVVVVVPNLTNNQRPYAFVENVITHEAYRGRGYATKLLDFAKGIAEKEHCYKIMLLTSAKEESTLKFYEDAGYNRQDKTAFIQWIE